MKLRDPWDLLQQTGDKSFYPKQRSKDKLDEQKQYINRDGENIQEVGNWNWSNLN